VGQVSRLPQICGERPREPLAENPAGVQDISPALERSDYAGYKSTKTKLFAPHKRGGAMRWTNV
jgi:hypothetical protein